MKFPEALMVTVLDQGSGMPVPNVAVLLTLFAAHKNNYGVGPAITDATGKVRFTRGACDRAIQTAQKMFLMDYHGALESCLPSIEVKLHEPDHLQNMLRNYRQSPELWD